MKITIDGLKRLIAEAVSAEFTSHPESIDEKAIQKKLEEYVDAWIGARRNTVYGDRRRPVGGNEEILKRTRHTLIERINTFTMYLDEQVGKETLKGISPTPSATPAGGRSAGLKESSQITVSQLRSLIRKEIINCLS